MKKALLIIGIVIGAILLFIITRGAIITIF